LGTTKDNYLLIVDDKPFICELLDEALSAEGFTTKTALNGDQAIRIMQSQAPSLILMDNFMPGKSGLQTLNEARGLIAGVPAIMLSAYGEDENIREAKKMGLIQHHFTKPFNILDLIQLIKSIMPPATVQAGNKAAAG
jgi:CheY-like chemotaxis protein